jgi:hypothetical protein
MTGLPTYFRTYCIQGKCIHANRCFRHPTGLFAFFAPTELLQSLNQGKGRISDFDYQRINEDLREQLLATCAPLALHVFQFQYAGEIRKSGGLRGLATRMKQTPLSVATLDEVISCFILCDAFRSGRN